MAVATGAARVPSPPGTDFKCSVAVRETTVLILTRRTNESVNIGDDITVTVLGIKGNHVRIGIGAPRHVSVHREEIYERVRREREAAGDPAQASGTDATTAAVPAPGT